MALAIDEGHRGFVAMAAQRMRQPLKLEGVRVLLNTMPR
jgi:hypothetical protein